MQLRLSDSNSMALRNRSTDKVIGRAVITGSDPVAMNRQINDILHATSLKLILRRNDTETVLLQDKLALLVLFTSVNRPFFPTVIDFAHKFSTVYPYSNDYVFTEGANVVFPFQVELGCVINLSGDDELFLDVNCQAQQRSGVANANINFDFDEAVGVGSFVACTRFESLPPGQSSWPKDLGNNVSKIAFINLDNNSIDATLCPISTLSLNSDKLQLSDTFYDLLLRRWYASSDAETAKKSYNCYIIYDGYRESTDEHVIELDKVKLNLELVSGAINQSMNYIAYRFITSDEGLLLRAEGMKAKHQGRDLLKWAKTPAVVAAAHQMKTAGESQQDNNSGNSGTL